MCAHTRVSVAHFPLELSKTGFEKQNTRRAVSIVHVLGIGQAPGDSQLLAASVCASHAQFWLESAMCLFYFLFFVIILLSIVVGNFTLALTDLAEAAQAIVPAPTKRRGRAGRGASAGPPPAGVFGSSRLPPTAVRALTGGRGCKEGAADPQCLSFWRRGRGGRLLGREPAPCELRRQPCVYVSTSV